MAYRRKTMTRSATFVEDHRKLRDEQDSSTSSLAAQAIRASALHRDSSLSSAYGDSAFNASSDRRINLSKEQETNKSEETSNDWTLIDPVKGTKAFKYQSMQSLNNNNNNTNNNIINNNNINNNDNNDNNNNNNDAKNGFWGVVARKAKSMLDENGADKNSQAIECTDKNQPNQSRWSYERLKKQENPTFQKGSDALKDIGGKIRKSLEEGLTMVENRTSDIIQETKKLQIMRKNSQNNDSLLINQIQIEINQSEIESQLKSSRDLANAMAAKAKLLLRELKTVKADLAFAKLRCSQLEEENKVLRDGRQKGATNEDDDLIRLQLETLLAEKSRLAHENSVYARENRFLREIVDFHQFNTHDVVSLEDEFEEDNDDFALDIHLQEQCLEREERETEGEQNLEREEMQLQNRVLEREDSTMESSVLERETESTNAEKEEREMEGPVLKK